MHKFFLIIFVLISFYSCKHTISHEETLKYYVTIQLQIKDVTSLVKAFSPELSKFIKNDSADDKNNKAEDFRTFKKSFFDLITEIDKRQIVLNDLKPLGDDLLMIFFARTVMNDTRNVLLDISSFISAERMASLSSKGIMIKKFGIRSKYDLLMLNTKYFLKWSEKYKLEHHITQSELSKYALL